jgi:hypothetical protein
MSDWLYQLALYANYIPIIVAIVHYKYLNKAIVWFLVGSLVTSICGIISIKLGDRHINNHFMMYVNACTNILLRTGFFYSFIHSNNYRKALIFCLIAYLSGVCVDIAIHGIYMNQYLFMVANVWAIFFFLVALNQILKDESIESLRDLPIFWLIIGTLFFVIFDFFLSVSNVWLYAVNRAFFFLLWDYITPIFMFISIIIMSIGYWKTKKYAENLLKT